MMIEKEAYRISETLSLTDIRISDVDDLSKHINHPEIADNTLTIPYPYKKSDGLSFIKQIHDFEKKHDLRSNYAIRYNGEFIGAIGLLYNYGIHAHRSEIGYWISSEYSNKGIMSRVMKTFIRICFEEKQLSRLEANVFLENLASQRVLEKNGFVREGILRDAFRKKKIYLSTILFSLLKKEWK